MPSTSKAQARLMAAAAHNPAFAKKVGVPTSVAKEFNQADKGKKFGGGGMAKKLFGGKESYAEEKKEAEALKSGKISDKVLLKVKNQKGIKMKNQILEQLQKLLSQVKNLLLNTLPKNLKKCVVVVWQKVKDLLKAVQSMVARFVAKLKEGLSNHG